MSVRAVLLAAASLVALTSSSPLPAELDLEARAQTCYSGVYMIVARGSEEDPGEGRPGAVAKLVESKLPNSASVAVDYPASIADPVYPASVSDGITDTINKVHAYVKACGSKSKIALIGFSQGGNVHTDALAGGVDKPAPLTSAYTKYITAVTVFGDPSFTVGQSFDVGNATKSGIFSRGGDSLKLLNTFASKLRSYCMVHDPYCASGDNGDVHSAEVATFESAAANFIVSRSK